MSAGIAVVFRKKFGRLDELRRQHPAVGKALRLQDGQRSIYYLVTKRFSGQKPDYEDLWSALLDLRKDLLSRGIRKLAVPKLGCGLDRLDWRVVRSMLEVIFQSTGIEIVVCSYNPRATSSWEKSVDCYFYRNGTCWNGAECRYRHASFVGQRGRNSFWDRTDLRRGQCTVGPTARAAPERMISPIPESPSNQQYIAARSR